MEQSMEQHFCCCEYNEDVLTLSKMDNFHSSTGLACRLLNCRLASKSILESLLDQLVTNCQIYSTKYWCQSVHIFPNLAALYQVNKASFIATTNTVCALMTANIKSATWPWDCCCSESLLYVHQNVHLVALMPSFMNYWLSCSVTLPSFRADMAVVQSTHPVLAAAVGVNPVKRLLIFKTWSLSIEMTISLTFVNGFQRMRYQSVQK